MREVDRLLDASGPERADGRGVAVAEALEDGDRPEEVEGLGLPRRRFVSDQRRVPASGGLLELHLGVLTGDRDLRERVQRDVVGEEPIEHGREEEQIAVAEEACLRPLETSIEMPRTGAPRRAGARRATRARSSARRCGALLARAARTVDERLEVAGLPSARGGRRRPRASEGPSTLARPCATRARDRATPASSSSCFFTEQTEIRLFILRLPHPLPRSRRPSSHPTRLPTRCH